MQVVEGVNVERMYANVKCAKRAMSVVSVVIVMG